MTLNKNRGGSSDRLTHLHGVVGRPEFKETSKGTVLNFGLGMPVNYGDDAETIWLDCSVWNESLLAALGDIAKGDRVAVSGFIHDREYEGKTYRSLNVTQIGAVEMVKRVEATPAKAEAKKPAKKEPVAAASVDDLGF